MPEESLLVSEPRWPAALALLSVGGLHYALPPELRIGPDWLVLVLVAALAIPATISHRLGNWRASQVLGYAAISAFSPPDVPVLSRWAKTLMMVQASISLATIALLGARAVNIL